MKNEVSKITLAINLILLGLTFYLPDNILEGITGDFRFGHIVSIILCPIIGIVGGYFGFKHNRKILAFLNLLFLFTYPVLYFVFYMV